jgi:hypothetical protein
MRRSTLIPIERDKGALLIEASNIQHFKMNPRALFVLATSVSALLSQTHAVPLLPEKLPYQEASIQQLIPYRDGVLVESDDSPADRVRYARFEAKKTETVAMEGIELLFDAEQSADGVLFLGLQDKKMVVVRETADRKRHPLNVPEAFHPRFLEDLEPSVRPRLIPTNHEVAAIAGDVVWWKDKEWRNRKLPKVPQFYHEFQPVDFGQVHFLEGTTLYAGWNHGEWGGMLASLDLSADGAQWIHLSGKPAGDPGIPKNEPVQAILSPSPGNLWVATGLAHLGGSWCGLHHRDASGKWDTLIDVDLEKDRSKLKLPVPSSIEGLAADRDGRVYILAGAAGIFRPGESGLERLFAHDFSSHTSDRGAYLAVSHPSDLAIVRNGDIFVSTTNFGVLAFRKKDGNWSAHQITLNKGDINRLKDISFPPSRHDK